MLLMHGQRSGLVGVFDIREKESDTLRFFGIGCCPPIGHALFLRCIDAPRSSPIAHGPHGVVFVIALVATRMVPDDRHLQ
jgi:hypothetical protein